MVDGEEVMVKVSLSGVVGGSLRNLSKDVLKQEWVKAKVVRRRVFKVSPPPPPKIFIVHRMSVFGSQLLLILGIQQ